MNLIKDKVVIDLAGCASVAQKSIEDLKRHLSDSKKTKLSDLMDTVAVMVAMVAAEAAECCKFDKIGKKESTSIFLAEIILLCNDLLGIDIQGLQPEKKGEKK